MGLVYVDDNTAGVNTVAGFDRHADGTLTPLPGSPFAGSGVIMGSQGTIQISADGRYLLAVDAGANYTGFSLNAGGHLAPLADSTVTLPAGSDPGDVLFSGGGAHLAGVRVGPSLIDSFAVGADGTLTPISPTPYPDQQTAPCWLTISPDGQNLFTQHGQQHDLALQHRRGRDADPAGQHGLGGGAMRPLDLEPDPSGSTLYVVDAGSDTLSAFAVSGGSSTEIPSSPTALPPGATPFGIVVD